MARRACATVLLCGYKIMSQIPAMKDFLPGMYMHHEMVNGQGYPQGLTDEQIPLQAKIVSVGFSWPITVPCWIPR